jgi:small subunit ribosomal protein S15
MCTGILFLMFNVYLKIMLTSNKKIKLIEKFQDHKKDTGSSQVQVALLTEKIKELTQHLRKHPKDNHSRRGLLKIVAKRKKLLDYLKYHSEKEYKKVSENLGLKK